MKTLFPKSFKKNPIKESKSKVSFLSLLVFLAIASITWKPIAINYGKWLAAGEEKPTGDMSVLLSGSNERLETLIGLYDQNKVGAIYYAGGIDETPDELAGYRQIFEKYNVPREDVYCGELVESTFHEAQAFQRKLADVKHPVDQIILVSDRYHLRRGVWSFNKVLGKNSGIEIAAFSTPSSPEIADLRWWKHQESRKYVISETKKMAFYWLYYGLLNQGKLITHGDVNQITKGIKAEGVEDPCLIVLP